MSGLLAAELLKVRKRWMPYVLFLVMLAGVAIVIWLGGYMEYKGQAEFQDSALRTFSLPWSIPALLDSGQFWGAMLVSVLTASVVATEYNWGTVRGCVSRGQTRGQFLAYKLLGLTTIAAVMLLAALAIGILFSIIATSAANLPVTLERGGGSVSAGEIVLMILRAGLGVLPYGLLAFALAVGARATAVAAAGTILYMFGESIIVAILGSIGGHAADARSLSIGHNVSSLIAANRIGVGDYNSMALRPPPEAAELPDPWVAALVLALYCAAFLAISFALFQRRDLR